MSDTNTLDARAPQRDCDLCPRLVTYRQEHPKVQHDGWHGALPPWGSADAELLIVGLAPSVNGANMTGRPFTGDKSGPLLYETLSAFGFADGIYQGRVDDGLMLRNCRIINAVRCAAPAGLPQPSEAQTCNQFLQAELQSMPRLKAVLALGVFAHNATLAACGIPMTRINFVHGQILTLPDGLLLADSYHVSRFSSAGGELSSDMFRDVISGLRHRMSDF